MPVSLSDFRKEVLETWPNNLATKTGTFYVNKYDKHNVTLPTTTTDEELYKAVQERKRLLHLQDAFIDFYKAIVAYETHATRLEDARKKDFEDISESGVQEKIDNFIAKDDRLKKVAAIRSSADAARKALPNLINNGEFTFTYDNVLTNHSDPFILRLLGDVLKGFAAIFSHLAALTVVGVILVTADFWEHVKTKQRSDGHFFSSGDTTSVALAKKVGDALIKVEAAIVLVNELIAQQDVSTITAPTPQ